MTALGAALAPRTLVHSLHPLVGFLVMPGPIDGPVCGRIDDNLTNSLVSAYRL